MNENIYESPRANVDNGNSNPFEAFDYHDLTPLVSGRKKILILFVFMVLVVLIAITAILAAILGVAGFESSIIGPLVAPIAIYGTAAYGMLSSEKWGLYAGAFAAILCLFVFPLGTIVGVVGLRGFYQAKSIYLTDEYSFKKLRYAFKKYT